MCSLTRNILDFLVDSQGIRSYFVVAYLFTKTVLVSNYNWWMVEDKRLLKVYLMVVVE